MAMQARPVNAVHGHFVLQVCRGTIDMAHACDFGAVYRINPRRAP